MEDNNIKQKKSELTRRQFVGMAASGVASGWLSPSGKNSRMHHFTTIGRPSCMATGNTLAKCSPSGSKRT